MRIDLVFPTLPPTIDGIGDHTARLAETLAARGCDVRVLTAQRDWTPLAGVDVRRTFHLENRRGVLELTDALRSDLPDWLFLQFEQFSYGRWGLNPFLPLAVHRLQRAAPQTRVAVMFHEDFMPASDVSSALIGAWQRPQFWMLGRLADVAFFSTEPRARTYDDTFSSTRVHHLPVGSNVPNVEADRARERERLGVDSGCVLMGLFGSAHPSRLLAHAQAAVSACAREGPDCQVLYVGPDGDAVQSALDADVPFRDAGPLPPREVSRRFAAMDLYLAPFRDGVSTRRGSFLTGLQHGVATASTQGPETGAFLAANHEDAFLAPPRDHRDRFVQHVRALAASPERRHELGRNGQSLYENHFSWPIVADHLLDALNATSTAVQAAYSE